jgi:hypothetical protein
MLFRELSNEAQMLIVDAMLGAEVTPPEGELKEEITKWANDPRNFTEEDDAV